MFVAIDPGKFWAGVAEFTLGKLTRAYLVIQRKTDPWLTYLDQLPRGVATGAVELPQVYPGAPARPEDLIQLAAMAGAIAGRCGGVWRQVRPAVWTRATCQNKTIRLQRVWDRLSPAEVKAVELPKSQARQLDVLDAVALGLYCLSRW